MLRIYPVILAFVGDVYPFIERIGRHDPDLARQLRRASSSVALNTAEGMYARGRQRTASYNIALREMRESYAALEVSVRLRELGFCEQQRIKLLSRHPNLICLVCNARLGLSAELAENILVEPLNARIPA